MNKGHYWTMASDTQLEANEVHTLDYLVGFSEKFCSGGNTGSKCSHNVTGLVDNLCSS